MDSSLPTPLETPQEIRREKSVYLLFRVSIIGKGLLSALEIVGGIAVLLIPPSAFLAIANFLTQGELAEEPTDFIAVHIQSAVQALISSNVFLSIYLLSRGLVKVFLVYALLKNKLWAYPLSIVVLSLFIFYQIYQMVASFSYLVLTVTIFDLIVIYFIWREYQIVREHQGRVVV